LVAGRLGGEYVTFDRAQDLEVAAADPETFLDALGVPAVLDEVQRVGDRLVVAVKAVVDDDQRPGRFLLTGSTNFLTVPTISETLAGRVDLVTLWPLAEAELEDSAGDLIARAFDAPERLVRHRGATPTRDEYLERVCRGGYPEAVRLAVRPRRRWFLRYADTVVEREIKQTADIRKGDALGRMLRLLASRTSQELVISELARRLAVERATAETYERWLETVFLVHRVPAWSRNLSNRVLHRPKTYVADTGLAAALLGKSPDALRNPIEPATGPLLETFVCNELAKQLTWSETDARLYHYRESGGTEVDLVIEGDDGATIAIEVKSTTAPRETDFAGLRMLQARLHRAGTELTCGILLHTGSRRATFSDRLVALPIADTWT